MKDLRILLGISTALAALLTTMRAPAVGTRSFELSSLDDLSGGDLTGTSVDSRGRVRAGLNLGAVGVGDASSVWSGLALPDGSVLLGTGSTGKIYRAAGGQLIEYARTEQLAVTSLVLGWDQAAFAATIPGGKVFKLGANGAATVFAQLDAKHVWALAFDRARNALYAATGPEGKLLRIDSTGRSQVYFDSDEPHLMSLALDTEGVLYAGSVGQGVVYRISGPGRASVLYDPPGEEVRALALDGKANLCLAANEYGELPELPKRTASQAPAGPASGPRPKPGKGTLFRIDRSGRPERLFRRDDTHFASLGIAPDGRVLVGTGVEGRVYAVDDDHTSALVADTDERQVTFIAMDGKKRFVATSDPPVFREVRDVGGADATWTSKILDAGLRARFGKVTFRTSGSIDLALRTGDTKVPDSTWSPWSPAITSPGKLAAPPGRFAQVRARFARDPNAELASVTIPFTTDNLRAVVTSVDAQPRNTPPAVREGQVVPSSGGEPPSHVSTIKLSWKVDNPDADPLRFRLAYRRDDERSWHELTRGQEPLTKTEFDWETSTFPEGAYRIRVEASDEAANPSDRTYRHALESSVIVVDNTPPVFRSISARNRTVVAQVSDATGPLARLDVALDGSVEFKPVLPKDGIFDASEEEFEFDLGDVLGPGYHLVAVRAFDQAGNVAIRSLELK